jgi:hypothetical protein
MIYPFLALAAVSPTRQASFRRAVVAHVLVLAGIAWSVRHQPPVLAATYLGYLLLCAGIVEGALLIGWRLTQLPRSQALEFILVSPLRPPRLFFGEAVVGLARLALVTLSGLPLLALLVLAGLLEPLDLLPLLVMPFTWGVVIGLGLAVWAYEPIGVRRWAERAMLGLVLLYLGVGVLAGEHLKHWIEWLPGDSGQLFLFGFEGFHRYNPFGTWRWWCEQEATISGERMAWLQAVACALVVALLFRAMIRLQGHFHDRHYKPVADAGGMPRPEVGDWPLSWWAVKRVAEYSGRVNFWLAGGFGVLYALFTIAGPHWPAWMGRRVFVLFEEAGGIPVIAAALVVLAAVPAAFQYGLWDSNAQDRCRRLELLLMTRLGARDYWEAAAAAAWRRGRGYFGVAALLWAAAVVAGRVTVGQGLAALAAGIILWGLYFAVGFRAFTRGIQANGLGLLLTLGLPMLAIGCSRAGWPGLGALLPPGSVYAPVAVTPSLSWFVGPLLGGAAALVLTRFALVCCEDELRGWYDRHHGAKVVD